MRCWRHDERGVAQLVHMQKGGCNGRMQYAPTVTMTYNPEVHHRNSIRLEDYDYAGNGAYFVTLCAFQRECLFGEIVDGEMRLNNIGVSVRDEWIKTPVLRQNVSLDEYVIMSNHFHGIVVINSSIVGAYCNTPDSDKRASCLRSPSQTIGAIIRGFKSATTKQINQFRDNPGCPVWQRNYYERVIRNEHELAKAREYIVNNPLKWALDKENPVNQQ